MAVSQDIHVRRQALCGQLETALVRKTLVSEGGGTQISVSIQKQ